MTEKRHQPIDFTNIRDLLSVVFKRKYTILAVFVVVFGAVALYTLLAPRIYEAKSILLVKMGREFMRTADGANSTPGLSVQPETIMKSEISILTSRDLMARVVNTLGIDRIYPAIAKRSVAQTDAEQAALASFEENLKVTNIPGSGLIQVAFSHGDPSTSATVVNTLVDAFKDKHLDVFGGKTTSFLERQEKAFQERLKESEDNLSNFKLKNQVFSFEEQKTNLIQLLGTLDEKLKASQNEISELEQRLAFVRGPRWTADLPAETRNQLVALQQKEQGLLERYTENSRTVQAVRQELNALKDAAGKAAEQARSVEAARIEGQLVGARAKAGSIRAQMKQVEGGLISLDRHGQELQSLKREAAQLEQNHQIYSRKLEESLIMDDMDRQKMVAVSVVQKATVPAFPKKQKLSRSQMLGAGFFGGVAAGIALAIILELMTPGMPTPESAEKSLGLPVLITVTKK